MGFAIQQFIIMTHDAGLLPALQPLPAHDGAPCPDQKRHNGPTQQAHWLPCPVIFFHCLQFLLLREGSTVLLAGPGSLFSPF